MTTKDSWFQRYLLPGFVFQSATIAGAYGTGRELAEFFLVHGPLGALLGMAVTTVIFSIVLVVTYEFARRFRLYDYRSFFRVLLGRGWPLYEILYWVLMILVISIVGAAAGDIVRDTFGLPPFVGIVGIMFLIAVLVFYGTSALERFFAVWSFVLYATYILLLGWHLIQNGEQILTNLTAFEIREGWLQNGVAYSGYNLATIPALLFCARHFGSRRDSVIAGILGGPITMLPAVIFCVAIIGQYGALVASGRDGVLPITILLNTLRGAEHRDRGRIGTRSQRTSRSGFCREKRAHATLDASRSGTRHSFRCCCTGRCNRPDEPGRTGIWHDYLGILAGLYSAGADLRPVASDPSLAPTLTGGHMFSFLIEKVDCPITFLCKTIIMGSNA
jgi:hypothetical protein